MAEGSGWGAGKIALVVIGGLLLLGVACCGISAFMFRGEIGSVVEMAQAMSAAGPRLETQLAERFPPGSVWSLSGDGPQMTFTIGLPTAPAPEEIEELQDEAWRAYVAAFPDGGFPLATVGIGVANGTSSEGHAKGFVKDWHDNAVSAEVVEERTGVAAPPILGFVEMIQEANENENVNIEVRGDGRAESPPGETPAGE